VLLDTIGHFGFKSGREIGKYAPVAQTLVGLFKGSVVSPAPTTICGKNKPTG
jgi:hypothetical protein